MEALKAKNRMPGEETPVAATLLLHQETQDSPERSSPVARAAAGLGEMKIQEETKSPVIRKGEGGKKVSLADNDVRLEVEKGKVVFEYDVKFSPPVNLKNKRLKCLNQHSNIIGPTKTLDGVSLYFPFQLPENRTLLQSKHPNDGSPVTVAITLKRHKKIGLRSNALFKNVSENSSRRRINRCMKCVNCFKIDCKSCKACKDKRKYGGPGTGKQSCLIRPKCMYVELKKEKNVQTVVMKTKGKVGRPHKLVEINNKNENTIKVDEANVVEDEIRPFQPRIFPLNDEDYNRMIKQDTLGENNCVDGAKDENGNSQKMKKNLKDIPTPHSETTEQKRARCKDAHDYSDIEDITKGKNDTMKISADYDDFEDTRDEVYLLRHDRAAAAQEDGFLDESWNDQGVKRSHDTATAALEDGLQNESWNDKSGNDKGVKIRHDGSAAALDWNAESTDMIVERRNKAGESGNIVKPKKAGKNKTDINVNPNMAIYKKLKRQNVDLFMISVQAEVQTESGEADMRNKAVDMENSSGIICDIPSAIPSFEPRTTDDVSFQPRQNVTVDRPRPSVIMETPRDTITRDGSRDRDTISMDARNLITESAEAREAVSSQEGPQLGVTREGEYRAGMVVVGPLSRVDDQVSGGGTDSAHGENCVSCRGNDKMKIKMEIELSTAQFLEVAHVLPTLGSATNA